MPVCREWNLAYVYIYNALDTYTSITSKRTAAKQPASRGERSQAERQAEAGAAKSERDRVTAKKPNKVFCCVVSLLLPLLAAGWALGAALAPPGPSNGATAALHAARCALHL